MVSAARDSLIGLPALPLDRATWLTGKPVSLKDLQAEDRPVILHFFAGACPHSTKQLSLLRTWWQVYQHAGLVILGIHGPEFPFEQDPDTVRMLLDQQQVSWPVIHDTQHAVWNSYENWSWPRLLLVDGDGIIRADETGEIDDELIERRIQSLLLHRGAKLEPLAPSSRHHHRLESSCYPASPELHFGYERGALQQQVHPDHIAQYQASGRSDHAGASLNGSWQVHSDRIIHTDTTAPGSLSIIFSGVGAGVVCQSIDQRPIDLLATLNGRAIPRGLQGTAVQSRGSQTILPIGAPGLYDVVRTTTPVAPAELRLVDDSGRLVVYAAHFSGCIQD